MTLLSSYANGWRVRSRVKTYYCMPIYILPLKNGTLCLLFGFLNIFFLEFSVVGAILILCLDEGEERIGEGGQNILKFLLPSPLLLSSPTFSLHFKHTLNEVIIFLKSLLVI